MESTNNSTIKYDTSICSNPKTIKAFDFINLLESLNCYEILPDDKKIKPYFDIEIKPKHCIDGQKYNDDWILVLNEAVKELKNHFLNPTICYLNGSSSSYICCKEGIEKWIISIHIVISNYKISKKKCMSIVNQMNKKQYDLSYAVNKEFQLFDDSIYNQNSKMRCAFANKSHYDLKTKKLTIEEGRPMSLEYGTKEQSVISTFFDEECIEIMDDEEVVDTPLQNIPKIQCNTENEMFINIALKNGFLKNHTTRKEWINMGCALHHSIGGDAGLNLFDLYSRHYSLWYDYEGLLKTWDSLRDINSVNKKPITIASIHKMCKDEDNDKYKQVIAKVKQMMKEQQNIQLESTIESKFTFDEMVKEFELTHCKIINKGFYIKQEDEKNIIMTKPHLITSYENLTYQKIIKEKITDCNFINDWIKNNPSMRCYDDVECYPDLSQCPSNIFNTWRPFAMELVKEYEPNMEALQMMRYHIKVLCNNNEYTSNYMESWIAQMVQYPAIKSNCPTIISKQGAGKGTLLKLISAMIGDDKYFETTTPSRDVWGDFNGRMANTFLVNLDELSRKESVECEGKIKGLITNPKMTINEKGVKQYGIISYHRFIGTTNHEDPLKIENDDRRNWIVRASDELIGNTEYFNKINEYLKDINVIKTCFEYFKSIPDMQNFNKLKMPISEYQQDMKDANISPIENWIKSFTLEHYYEDNVELIGKKQFDLFNEWCKNSGIDYKINLQAFGLRMKRLNINGIEKGKHTNKGETKIFNIKELL
jgi:hypothetical protein